MALLMLNAIVQSVVLHQYFHRAFRTGMRLKSAMISAIYDKALRVKPGAVTLPAKGQKAKAKGKDKAEVISYALFNPYSIPI